MSPLDRAVLVLNAGWTAVHVAPVRRAVSLVYRGLAQLVTPAAFCTHDFDAWVELSRASDNGCLRSASLKFMVPEIVRLRFFKGRQSRKVRFTRNNIFERDDRTCQYCGKKLSADRLTLDHVVPRSRGGRSTWGNLAAACMSCNDRKGDRLPEEAGMKLLRRPRKPEWSSYLAVRLGGGNRPSWRRFIESAGWGSKLEGHPAQ